MAYKHSNSNLGFWNSGLHSANNQFRPDRPFRIKHWSELAACQSHVNLFILADAESPEVLQAKAEHNAKGKKLFGKSHAWAYNEEKIKKAQAICQGCPVISECYRDADEYDLAFTVRGGRRPEAHGLPVGRPKGSRTIYHHETDAVCPNGHTGQWEKLKDGHYSNGNQKWKIECRGCKRPRQEVEDRNGLACKRGHVGAWLPSGNGNFECRTCRNLLAAGAKLEPVSRAQYSQKTHCRKGHNNWSHEKGSRRCKTCRNESTRQRKLRAVVQSEDGN